MENNIKKSVNNKIRIFIKKNTISIVKKKKLKNETNKIIIVISKNLISIAKNFIYFLEKINYTVLIIHNLLKIHLNDIHNWYIIIYNDRKDGKVPKKHIFYQIEQSNHKNFDINIMNKYNIIWDFSLKNYDKYSYVPLSKVFYMPIPFYFNDNIIYDNFEYDIFFYGINNKRQLLILNNLKSKGYNIIFHSRMYGDDRDNFIKKSKIIINLHYYNNSALETTRFNEVLNFNKLIISETSNHKNDIFNRNLYNNYVHLIDCINDDLSNIDILYNALDLYLSNEKLYNDKIEYIKNNKYKIMDTTNYFLEKNLLTINLPNKLNINYELKENIIYCLSLVETPKRVEMFKKQKIYINNSNIFEFYPAIKYNPGWKGCALSYVNLITNAKKYNLKKITICEDDCCFNNDFIEKYKIINEFLDIIKEWDIFVGVIADLPTDTTLYKVYKYKGNTFIQINKMHSTVFNIYNSSVYETIINWDIKTEKRYNQIDQYIKHKNLKLIIPVPFEFSCLNCDSTLWEKNLFDSYNKLFEKSNKVITKLINEFIKTNNIIYL